MVENLKTLTISFAEKSGLVDCEVSVEEREGGFSISIRSDENKDYIGRDKERFEAFTHLLRRMAEKITGEDKKISVDINNRQQKQDETLKTKAKIIAERAREFKKDVEMEPMSSYERMIIHSALEGIPSIKTESAGIGRERRVVVKFVKNKDDEDFSLKF
ncbi:MAG: R3H domain-containing nucleic acid-binding protein [Candidatus Paceibacterota bacterium]